MHPRHESRSDGPLIWGFRLGGEFDSRDQAGGPGYGAGQFDGGPLLRNRGGYVCAGRRHSGNRGGDFLGGLTASKLTGRTGSCLMQAGLVHANDDEVDEHRDHQHDHGQDDGKFCGDRSLNGTICGWHGDSSRWPGHTPRPMGRDGQKLRARSMSPSSSPWTVPEDSTAASSPAKATAANVTIEYSAVLAPLSSLRSSVNNWFVFMVFSYRLLGAGWLY